MSLIAWIDYDEKQRQRMNDLIKLFANTDARDELGLGVIRNSLSDLFFPGTTTIQTRIRYMLFIPWIYKHLEDKKVSSADFKNYADRDERKLIEPLKNSAPDEWGLFGRIKGDIQRLPSSVYWSGLGQWGIRLFDGSQDDYCRNLDDFYRIRSKIYIKSDKEEAIENAKFANWHLGIPQKPEDFPKNISFELTKDEAEYLIERIKTNQPDSLFAEILNWPEQLDTQDIWLYPKINKFSKEQQNWIEHARLFSKVMHGAALLYNFLIAELLKDEGNDRAKEWIKRYRKMVENWREDICAEYDRIKKWDMAEFWNIVNVKASGDYWRAKKFVLDWLEIICSKADLEDILLNRAARNLIYRREEYLKGRYARLSKVDARNRWNGKSGSGIRPYDFRWPIAQNFLNEIFKRLRGK